MANGKTSKVPRKRVAAARALEKRKMQRHMTKNGISNPTVTSEMIEEKSTKRLIHTLENLLPRSNKCRPSDYDRTEYSTRSWKQLPYKAAMRKHCVWHHIQENDAEEVRNDPYYNLSCELHQFAKYVSLNDDEKESRSAMIADIQEVVRCKWGTDPVVIPFGSYVAGLSTFYSDIDLSISMENEHKYKSDVKPITPVKPDTIDLTQNSDDLDSDDYTGDDECGWTMDYKGDTTAASNAVQGEELGASSAPRVSSKIAASSTATTTSTTDNGAPASVHSTGIVETAGVVEYVSDGDNSDDEDWQDISGCDMIESDFQVNAFGFDLPNTTTSLYDPKLSLTKNQPTPTRGNNRKLLSRTTKLLSQKKQASWLAYLFSLIKTMQWVEASEVRARAKVPIINLIHKNGVECDVSMEMDTTSATAIILEVVAYANKGYQVPHSECTPSNPNPPSTFHAIVMFLKVFLGLLQLDIPFKGGIGSHRLYFMVAFVMNANRQNIASCGQLLIAFFNHFRQGKNFNEQSEIRIGSHRVDFGATRMVGACRNAFSRGYDILVQAIGVGGSKGTSNVSLKYVPNNRHVTVANSPAVSNSILSLLLDTAALFKERTMYAERCRKFPGLSEDEKTTGGERVLLDMQRKAGMLDARNSSACHVNEDITTMQEVLKYSPSTWARIRSVAISRPHPRPGQVCTHSHSYSSSLSSSYLSDMAPHSSNASSRRAPLGVLNQAFPRYNDSNNKSLNRVKLGANSANDASRQQEMWRLLVDDDDDDDDTLGAGNALQCQEPNRNPNQDNRFYASLEKEPSKRKRTWIQEGDESNANNNSEGYVGESKRNMRKKGKMNVKGRGMVSDVDYVSGAGGDGTMENVCYRTRACTNAMTAASDRGTKKQKQRSFRSEAIRTVKPATAKQVVAKALMDYQTSLRPYLEALEHNNGEYSEGKAKDVSYRKQKRKEIGAQRLVKHNRKQAEKKKNLKK